MKILTIIISIVGFLIIGAFYEPICDGNVIEQRNISLIEPDNVCESADEMLLAPTPDQLIRFHVLANSDSEQDQAMKRAVRDAILEEVSPRLAVAKSLDESRRFLKDVRPEMEDIGHSVVMAWGKDYTVTTEYGHFSFPTKSYGSLVLPAGDYESLRVVIGEGKGSNWWCVLFPPLCFIDIDHSTAVQVDGKPGIPISKGSIVQPIKQTAKSTSDSPKVRFYFWEMIKSSFGLCCVLS